MFVCVDTRNFEYYGLFYYSISAVFKRETSLFLKGLKTLGPGAKLFSPVFKKGVACIVWFN